MLKSRDVLLNGNYRLRRKELMEEAEDRGDLILA